MGAAEIIGLIGLAREMIGSLVTQAGLLAADQQITPAELDEIKAKAGLSDSAWDEAVAAARARGGG